MQGGKYNKMDNRLKEGLLLARKAGSFLKDSRNNPCVSQNFDYDIKLKQDRESEEIIISGIEKKFPDDGFISEERGEKKGLSGNIWIIDPLDGTVNYARGIPQCCISIACKKKDGDSFGIVYDFFREEIFRAVKGEGAFLNEKRIKTSDTQNFKDAIICFGLMKSREDISSGLNVFSRLALEVKKVRMMGAAALDLCYVASGRTDFFLEIGLNVWDIAAGSIIVEEAGGEYREFLLRDKVVNYAGNRCLDVQALCQMIKT